MVEGLPCTNKAVRSNPALPACEPSTQEGSTRTGVLSHPEAHETLNQKRQERWRGRWEDKGRDGGDKGEMGRWGGGRRWGEMGRWREIGRDGGDGEMGEMRERWGRDG